MSRMTYATLNAYLFYRNTRQTKASHNNKKQYTR